MPSVRKMGGASVSGKVMPDSRNTGRVRVFSIEESAFSSLRARAVCLRIGLPAGHAARRVGHRHIRWPVGLADGGDHSAIAGS